MITASRPAFAGRSFRVDYDGLSAHNHYSADASRIRYAIVSGTYAGAEGVYVISWQEADGATVVHVDDFANGRSQAFFTATDLSFHRMHGPLTAIDA